MSKKWTEGDVPDQSDRVAVVTGANTGLGYDTARVLAGAGATVVLAVRDVEKGKKAADKITAAGGSAEVQRLDLGSLDAIRTAADELRDRYPRIDLLINNAGVMYPPKSTTTDGFELQFGTNHLGHFALTGLLLEHLLVVPGSRVVTVSSLAHRQLGAIHFDDLQWEKRYTRVESYSQSKLANLMFTYELQRRLAAAAANTIAVAAHPGLTATELSRHLPSLLGPGFNLIAQDVKMGALPTLRAAVDPDVEGGQFYGPDTLFEVRGHPKLVKSNGRSHDQAVQERLWTVSEDLTGVSFPV